MSFPELEPLLNLSESLYGDPLEINEGSFFQKVKNADGATDKSVLLWTADFLPAVEIVGDITLHVHAVKGAGKIVVRRAQQPSLLEISPLIASVHRAPGVTLRSGDKYGYFVVGRQTLVVRDDCSVPFFPEYERDVLADDYITRYLQSKGITRPVIQPN